jgi:hypothetical protein
MKVAKYFGLIVGTGVLLAACAGVAIENQDNQDTGIHLLPLQTPLSKPP